MELLWQKESAEGDVLYRDLFVNIKEEFPECMFYDYTSMTAKFMETTMKKLNAFSEQRRRQGNQTFKEGKFCDASKAYSECLCLAENNTEHVALAYANRSACHYALKMYGKCLVDIDLALREQLPKRLKLKLENRRADATKWLPSEVGAEKFEVKLSYEADETFPFMANVLEIRRNGKFGRYITAKCDIPAGKTVVFEKNFVTHTKANSYINKDDAPIRCVTCNKAAANPIPCLKCTIVMFCGTECRDGNKVHQMDCGAVYHWVGTNNKYIIQSILIAVSMFPTIDDLMRFVVDAVQADKFEIPERLIDERSNYRMFLKLWQPSKMANFIRETYTLYTTIMRLDAIKMVFDSPRKQRFLMHLMGQHALILLHNGLEGQLGIFSALFNHSCVPNVQEVWIDNRTACMTIRPIRKGEQLFICYMPEVLQKVYNLDVKSELYAKFEFRCGCVKCKDELADLKKIERDSGFCDLNNTSIYDEADKVLIHDFIEKSFSLLNKYSRVPWSYQLDHISKRLGFFLGRFYFSVEVK